MNKFNLFLLLCISFFQISLGQTSVTSYDGYSYSVGDTIQLGYPIYLSQSYKSIFYSQDRFNTTYYKKVPKGNFPLSYVRIENIIPTEQNEVSPFMEKSPLLQVRCYENSDSILFINLDYAIAQKEIVRNLKNQQPKETLLKQHTLLTFYHKVLKKEITDELLLQYISSKDEALGKEYKGNKFKFQKDKTEWLAIFEKEMGNLDFNKTYYFEIPVKHSDYDFEKSGYWISYDSDLYDIDKNVIRFAPYYFLLQNYTSKNFLHINPEVAEKFETTQKGVKYYSWYGTLYARVFFHFSKDPVVFPKTNKGIAMSIIYDDNLINIEIEKVDIFDHNSYKYNYVGTIK